MESEKPGAQRWEASGRTRPWCGGEVGKGQSGLCSTLPRLCSKLEAVNQNWSELELRRVRPAAPPVPSAPASPPGSFTARSVLGSALKDGGCNKPLSCDHRSSATVFNPRRNVVLMGRSPPRWLLLWLPHGDTHQALVQCGDKSFPAPRHGSGEGKAASSDDSPVASLRPPLCSCTVPAAPTVKVEEPGGLTRLQPPHWAAAAIICSCGRASCRRAGRLCGR